MDRTRLRRVVAALASARTFDASTYPQRVCAAAVRLLGMSGAGLTLMGGDDLGALWASDEVLRQVDEAQLGLGEGPGLDAFRLGAPVLEPDMAGLSTRWPFFRQVALELGVGAFFALPLQVGAISVGVLNLYRREPGFLSDNQLADALILADVATQDLLDLQAMGELPWMDPEAPNLRASVHQATGMVAAQLNISVASALARLRAHAFSTGVTIHEVAENVLRRRQRFDEA